MLAELQSMLRELDGLVAKAKDKHFSAEVCIVAEKLMARLERSFTAHFTLFDKVGLALSQPRPLDNQSSLRVTNGFTLMTTRASTAHTRYQQLKCDYFLSKATHLHDTGDVQGASLALESVFEADSGNATAHALLTTILQSDQGEG